MYYFVAAVALFVVTVAHREGGMEQFRLKALGIGLYFVDEVIQIHRPVPIVI